MSKLIFANIAKTAYLSRLRAQKKFARNLAKIKSLEKPRQNKLAILALQTIQESMTKARPGKRKEGNERKGAKNVSTYHDALMRLNAF